MAETKTDSWRPLVSIDLFKLYWISAALFLIFCCGCSPNDKGSSTYRLPNTEMIEVVDIGDVYPFLTPELTHTFYYKNKSSENVRILNKSVSCGCTLAKLSKEILGDNETLNLDLKVNIAKDIGKRQILITLHTDDKRYSNKSFILKFNSIPKITSDLKSLEFGDLTKNTDSDQTRSVLHIYRTTFAKEYIPDLKVISSHDGISTRLIQRLLKKEKSIYLQTWTYEVSLNGLASAYIGYQKEQLKFLVTDLESINISVAWNVNSSIKLTPKVVSFGRLDTLNNSVDRKVVFVYDSESDLKIVSVDSDESIISSLNDRKGFVQECLLNLSTQRIRFIGPQHGTIQFRVSDGSTVKCEWFALINEKPSDTVSTAVAPIGK